MGTREIEKKRDVDHENLYLKFLISNAALSVTLFCQIFNLFIFRLLNLTSLTLQFGKCFIHLRKKKLFIQSANRLANIVYLNLQINL